MASVWTTLLLWLATLGVLVVAGVPANAAVRIRNSPGTSDADTLDVVGRALQLARLQTRDSKYSMNKTSLAKSWVGATLFKYGGDNETTVNSHNISSEIGADIEIVCTTCYVNGSVTGDLTLTGDFNFTEAIDSVTDQFEAYIEEVAQDIEQEIKSLNTTNLPTWPTLVAELDLDNVTGLPGASIHFEFDDLELYLELDIKLSAGATYTLNLYTSESPGGISVPGVTIGAVFSVDLILIADAEIDIGSGIHIKLDDGLAFDLEMFNSNVSTVTIPGGAYEFLPVTISGEGSIQALLSLKASLGVNVNTPDTSAYGFKLDAGVETDVFAYVADFLTQVNGSTAATDNGDCELAAVAEYTLAVGAAAGATLAIDKSYSWGPSPNTTIPVWYTTLASLCATTKTVTSTAASVITARAELGQRDDSSLTTTTSTTTYQIVNCVSAGLINCPINLQNTTIYSAVVTSVLAVESGSTVTLPTNGGSALVTGIPFGSKSQRLDAISGTPTSYVPPPPPPPTTSATASATPTGNTAGNGSGSSGKTSGPNDKLIIGLSVGLGVPFLAAVLAGLWYIIRHHRKYSEVAQKDNVTQSPGLREQSPVSPGMMQKAPLVSVEQSH